MDTIIVRKKKIKICIFAFIILALGVLIAGGICKNGSLTYDNLFSPHTTLVAMYLGDQMLSEIIALMLCVLLLIPGSLAMLYYLLTGPEPELVFESHGILYRQKTFIPREEVESIKFENSEEPRGYESKLISKTTSVVIELKSPELYLGKLAAPFRWFAKGRVIGFMDATHMITDTSGKSLGIAAIEAWASESLFEQQPPPPTDYDTFNDLMS